MSFDDIKIIALVSGLELGIPSVKCDTQEELLGKLRTDHFDVAIIDYNHHGKLSIVDFLRVVGHRAPLLPIILLDSAMDKSALSGLVDLILSRDITTDELIVRVEKLVSHRQILAECGLVGRSNSLQVIAETIFRVAPTEIPVLITGETGTGKELIANSIHKHSARKDGEFLAINCSAIPETLLEAQLFGYKKGAFTGANKDTPGFFDKVKQGTLFLDEIGEIPQNVQVKLLRVLESKEYFPVGDVNPQKADIRLISATNQDLKNLMLDGKFREDLYYRISGVNIYIPPLRERREDIPILAFFFAKKIAQEQNISFANFSDDAIEAMLDYHWPGNVRELRNLVENAVMLAGGSVIHRYDLIAYFTEHRQLGRRLPVSTTVGSENINSSLRSMLIILQQNNRLLHGILEKMSNPPSIDAAEKEAIERALQIANGSRKRSAEILGISVRTLYRKMKKYNIQ